MQRYEPKPWDIRRCSMVRDEQGEYVRYDEAQATIARLTKSNERWRTNSIETWHAMQTMRNAINEHVPMPSAESDLLQGPENSIFCATVAEAVIGHITRLTAERDEARAEAAATALAEPKPVAWVAEEKIIFTDGEWMERLFIDEPEEGPRYRNIRPLYAKPQPGTSALAEMLDAETRACIEASSNAATGYSERQAASKGKEARDWESMKLAALFIRDLLTARLDQRKEAGE